MTMGQHLDNLSNLLSQNRLLKFAIIALMVGFAYDRYEIRQMRLQDRTIVVPPVVNSKIVIQGGRATDSYIQEYVIRYFVPLMLSYTPSSARGQFSEALSSWHRDSHEEAKAKLYLLADQIEQSKAVSSFYVGNKINHDPSRKIVEFEGNRRLSLQDQPSESTNKAYVMTYVVENGRFWVTSFEEKLDKSKAIEAGVSNALK